MTRRPWKQLRIALFIVLIGSAADHAQAGSKLFVGGLSWNTADEGLVMELSVHRQFARDGGDYFIASVVHIFDIDGNLVARLFPDPVAIKIKPLQDRLLIRRVEDQVIPWDRNGGNFRGPALVDVMVQLFDRTGRPVNNGDASGSGFVTIGAE